MAALRTRKDIVVGLITLPILPQPSHAAIDIDDSAIVKIECLIGLPE